VKWEWEWKINDTIDDNGKMIIIMLCVMKINEWMNFNEKMKMNIYEWMKVKKWYLNEMFYEWNENKVSDNRWKLNFMKLKWVWN
jgi:hypothetical protein